MNKVLAILALMAFIAIVGSVDAGQYYSIYSSPYWVSSNDFGWISWNPASGWHEAYSYPSGNYYTSYWGYVNPWGW